MDSKEYRKSKSGIPIMNWSCQHTLVTSTRRDEADEHVQRRENAFTGFGAFAACASASLRACSFAALIIASWCA